MEIACITISIGKYKRFLSFEYLSLNIHALVLGNLHASTRWIGSNVMNKLDNIS